MQKNLRGLANTLEEYDIDTLLKALRRRKAVAILLQVRARIQELDELVDFLEEQGLLAFDDGVAGGKERV